MQELLKAEHLAKTQRSIDSGQKCSLVLQSIFDNISSPLSRTFSKQAAFHFFFFYSSTEPSLMITVLGKQMFLGIQEI